MHYYLAPWRWVATGPYGWHRPVRGTRGALDLRTLPEQGQRGVVSGAGAFAYEEEQIVADGVYFGQDLDAPVPAARRNLLGQLLGRSVQSGETFRGILLDRFTTRADPTGATGTKPPISRFGGRVRLRFGGQALLDEPFAGVHVDRALAVFRTDYERMREEGEDRETLQKIAGAASLQYLGRLTADVLADNLRSDGVRQPETSFSESFPTVSATISSGQDQPWTEVLGNMDVQLKGSFNCLVSRTTNDYASARCETVLSSADHYMDGKTAYITAADQLHLSAIMTRFEAAADSGYFLTYWKNGAGDNFTFGKRVAGSVTFLADEVATDPSVNTPYQVRLLSSGSEHSGYLDTVLTLNGFTDTALTAGVRIGATQFTNNDAETLLHTVTASDEVVLAPPTGLSATPDGSDIALAWTDAVALPVRVYRRYKPR